MSGTSNITLVLTHGRDQAGQVPSTEARQWADAVHDGLARLQPPYTTPVQTAFAFYGDLWLADANDLSVQGTLGASSADVQLDLVSDMLAATGQEVMIPEGSGPWDSLATVIRTLDSTFHVGELALGSFLADLGQYLTRPTLREQVMGRLAATIAAAPGPVCLLGHSMGTVVAYDLLLRHPQPQVQTLITFGSVLGYDTIQRHVNPAGTLGPPYPPGLPRWINIYNEQDFATVVRQLAPIYRLNGQEKVEDRAALGLTPGVLTPMRAHDPTVYLMSATMAKALHEILTA